MKPMNPIRPLKWLALLLALGAGMMLMLLAWLFSAPVAAAMGAMDAVHRQAVVYIQWRACGAPAVLLTMTAFGVLYGLQDMRMPLVIAVGVNAINIGLDWILIFGWGPVPALGITGAAVASAASPVARPAIAADGAPGSSAGNDAAKPQAAPPRTPTTRTAGCCPRRWRG